jgi:lysozyme
MKYHRMIEQLKQHEGLELKPYRCTSGKLTIGYGRNLEAKGISKGEAESMLFSDIAEVEDKLVRAGFLSGLNDARKAVLINMAFQLGFKGLSKFRNMLAAVQSEQYDLAASEMLDSLWAKQTPNRAKELSEQMLTGEFQ